MDSSARSVWSVRNDASLLLGDTSGGSPILCIGPTWYVQRTGSNLLEVHQKMTAMNADTSTAVLAGSSDFIEEAFRLKHLLGGAMRQSGIIAAAGVYALEHNLDRLAEDHDNARHLARRLAQIPGIKIDTSDVETNLVFFDINATDRTAPEISKALKAKGVFIGAMNGSRMRAVTHLGISQSMVDEAADTMSKVLN